jgi:hypothetical protein
MALDLHEERQQAHALLDLLPPAKLGAVRSLLEVMIDDDDEELSAQDRAAIQAGLDSLDRNGGVPMEDVLADFGFTMADFDNAAAASDPGAKRLNPEERNVIHSAIERCFSDADSGVTRPL